VIARHAGPASPANEQPSIPSACTRQSLVGRSCPEARHNLS
jgi:hypothetical protein